MFRTKPLVSYYRHCLYNFCQLYFLLQTILFWQKKNKLSRKRHTTVGLARDCGRTSAVGHVNHHSSFLHAAIVNKCRMHRAVSRSTRVLEGNVHALPNFWLVVWLLFWPRDRKDGCLLREPRWSVLLLTLVAGLNSASPPFVSARR